MHIRLVIVIAMLMVGCTDEEPTGEIEAALSSTGTDGAVYRLPEDTLLYLRRGALSAAVPLDGAADAITFPTPVGAYQVSLIHPAGYTTSWPLERTNGDGSKDTVQARLVGTMPLAVTVLPNATTAIVFTFRVAGSVTVVFVRGRITVTTEVVNVPATSQDVTIGSPSITADFVEAVPSVASMLPGLNEELFVTFSAKTTGAWDLVSLTDACAPASVLGWAASPGLDELLLEANGAAEVCVEQVPGGGQQLGVHLSRTGPANTSIFGGLGELTYMTRLSFALDEPVFDGETLELGALEGTDQGRLVGVWTTVQNNVVLYDAAFTGLGTTSVIPRE